jgi:hypothetical protein
MQTEEARVLAMGDYCENLLKQDAFNELYAEFTRDRFNWMVGSAPHETKKREGIYAEMNALGEFLSLMRSYVSKRDVILKQDQPSIADDSDDEHEST